MIATTKNHLADLAVDGSQTDDPNGTGTPPLTMYRPTNRPLRNDGVWRHWMQRGFVYDLEHDGTGWHVTSKQWTDREGAHIYRLAEPLDGRLMNDLPAADGTTIELSKGRTYQVRETTPGGAWALFA